jgi:drug/metabolite transporter (DMT)-like permease
MVAIAGALLGAHLGLFLWGLTETSLAAAVSLVSLEPLSVVLVAYVAFGIRPTRRQLTGLVVAVGGAAVVASGAGSGEHRLFGDVIVLVAVSLYGAYVASARGLRDVVPATPFAAAVYGAASLALLPVVLVQPVGVFTTRNVGAVLGLAFITTLIGHTLVQRAARTASPVLVALVSPGETVGGIFLGALLIGAWPSGREALGALIIVLGVVVTVTR